MLMPDEPGYAEKRKYVLHHQGVIAELALDFAKSFEEDNPIFDPIKFLDACSPDEELYPLSELW